MGSSLCPHFVEVISSPQAGTQLGPSSLGDPSAWENLPSSLGAPGEDSESDELPPGPPLAEALPTASLSHFFLFFGGGSAFTFVGLVLGSREVVDCPAARLRSVLICRPLAARSLRKGRSLPRVTLSFSFSFSFSFSTGRGGDGFSVAGGSSTAGSGVSSGGFSDVAFSGVSGLAGGAGALDGGAELPPTGVGPLL